MNKMIRLLLIMLVVPLVASAQSEDSDSTFSVTFRVNTSSVSDTLRVVDKVLMRGTFRQGVDGSYAEGNFYGQEVNWGTGTLSMNNVGGDYWEMDVTMAPGDAINFKYFPMFADSSNSNTNSFDSGWEAGDPRNFVLPVEANEDVIIDLAYWNFGNPFTQENEDSVGIFFRVNVGAPVATNLITDESKVGVRGSPSVMRNPDDWGSTTTYLKREPVQAGSKNVFYSGIHYVPNELIGESFEYKFVIENGSSTDWESRDNRPGKVSATDSTFYFGFYSNQRPPVAEIVNLSLQFAVNVGVLEGLGLFNRAAGDVVEIRGSMSDWGSSETSSSTYFETSDAWSKIYNLTKEVGAKDIYKYFIKWDESRWEEGHANYNEFVADLPFENGLPKGYEEPGISGGGNRTYIYTNEIVQNVFDNQNDELAYYNGVPPFGVITETVSGLNTMNVTFKIDMTEALSHTIPFDPSNDSLFLAVQTPVWGFTQDLTVNPDGFTYKADEADRLLFTRIESSNMYELVFPMKLPADNHIGFSVAYKKPDGTTTFNGSGFDAGRRYYRYIYPIDSQDREAIIWPDNFNLKELVWTATNLDWEMPLCYCEDDPIPTSIDSPINELVNRFQLFNNYPNPFNPSTNISFNLPSSEFVELSVFNVLGQKVASVLSQQMTAGTHSVAFNARNLASGVYIYQIRAGSFVQNKTMMLVK